MKVYGGNMSDRLYHEDGTLPPDGWIFVFGSNLSGIHGAGAAKVANEKYGAVFGNGVGLMGQSYAIPTKNKTLVTMPIDEIKPYIDQFIYVSNMQLMGRLPAPNRSMANYFVTRVGCGLAGYRDYQIAPLFKGAKNCSFANEWYQYLEG